MKHDQQKKNLSWWCIKNRIFSISLETSFSLSTPFAALSWYRHTWQQVLRPSNCCLLCFSCNFSRNFICTRVFPVVIVSLLVHSSSQQATLPFGLASLYAGTTGDEAKHAFTYSYWSTSDDKFKCFFVGYWWDACCLVLSFLSPFARSQAAACEHCAYPEWLLQLVGNNTIFCTSMVIYKRE